MALLRLTCQADNVACRQSQLHVGLGIDLEHMSRSTNWRLFAFTEHPFRQSRLYRRDVF